jgi:hypothetical protein
MIRSIVMLVLACLIGTAIDFDPGTDSVAMAAEGRQWTVASDGSGDMSSISEAVQKAASGDTILVDPGLYHESIVVDKSLEIVGRGDRDEIIIQSTEGDCLLIESDRTVVRGLTMRCRTGDESSFYAVDVAQGNALIEDCCLTSNSLAGCGIHGEGVQATIRDCWIFGSPDVGLYLYDHAQGLIEDCDIFDNRESGVAIQENARVTIRGCRIHHNLSHGIAVTKRGRAELSGCSVFANLDEPTFRDKKSELRIEESRLAGTRIRAESIQTNIDDQDDAVDPSLQELVIKFPEPMDSTSWFFTETDDSEYGEMPEVLDQPAPRFRDSTTFAIPVKLRPDTRYAIQLNAEDHPDFQSARGCPLEETVVYFKTGQPGETHDEGSVPEEELSGFEVGLRVLTFLQRPSDENFMKARAAVIKSDDYRRAKGNELDVISGLLDEEKYQEARSKIIELMPCLYLSPRVHGYASLATKGLAKGPAGRMGDDPDKEVQNLRNCLRGILSTGDGSKEHPYLVLRISDEYDVLSGLGKEKQRQSLVHHEGKPYDVISCRDGSSIWFDISSFFGR